MVRLLKLSHATRGGGVPNRKKRFHHSSELRSLPTTLRTRYHRKLTIIVRNVHDLIMRKRTLLEIHCTQFSPALRKAFNTFSLTDCSLYRDVLATQSSENLGFIRRTSAASARASFSWPALMYAATNII